MSYMIRGVRTDVPESEILWGLNDDTPNEEVVEKVFELIRTNAFLPTATLDGGEPAIRVIEYTRLSDGKLYLCTAKDKRFYRQLIACPRIAVGATLNTWAGLRMNAVVREVSDDPAIFDEYISLNPGTAKMFRHDLHGAAAIFELVKGEGEMYHLYDSDHIRRVRFAFGGAEKKPRLYRITDACVGCGTCLENCSMEAICQLDNGRYRIREDACEECGICYRACPLSGTALVRDGDQA